MVVKIKATQLVEYYNGGYEIFPWPRRELPTGKVSISLKYGRRWRMVAGRVDSMIDESCGFMPAMQRYFFHPNNPNKLVELLKHS